jgi:hypothetical protein
MVASAPFTPSRYISVPTRHCLKSDSDLASQTIPAAPHQALCRSINTPGESLRIADDE